MNYQKSTTRLLLLVLVLSLALTACAGTPAQNESPATETPKGSESANELENNAEEIGGGNPSTGNTLDSSFQLDQSKAEKVFKISWSVNFDRAHPYTAAATAFAEYLYEKTDGRIVVEYYPSAQLGDDPSSLQQIMLGTLDLQVCSTPFVSAFTNKLAGADMPFLCDGDLSLMYEVQNGEIGRKLLDAVEQELNIKCLTFCYQPFRHFFTNKEIKSVEDYKGLKMRAMNSPVHLDTFTAMGMNPTPVPFPEIYTMMQQGAIDGWDSDIIGIVTGGFYEVVKYCTISGHFNNSVMINMSNNAFNSLSPEDQALVMEAAQAAADASYQTSLEQNDKRMQEAQELGIIVNEIDMEPIKEAVQPVIDKWCAEVPECKEFVDAVNALKAERGQ